MAIEIEAKMRIDGMEEITQRLRAEGASYVGTVTERNTYFDTPEASLKSADEGLRVRTELQPHDNSTRVVVTYKGPRQAGPFKTRREIEFTVSDADAAESLFDALHYIKVLTFEKRRQTWRLDHCEVVLDTLPELGHFLEIEGPGEAAVDVVRRRLGLEDHPLITTSYLGLICGHLEDHGRARGEFRF